MSERKRYEQLESLPAYGPMYIPVNDDGEPFYSEGLVIRFYRQNRKDWVANFKPGLTGLNAIYELVIMPNILVIAGGKAYIMDPDKEIPVSILGSGFEQTIKTLDHRIIIITLTNLTIIETNGEYWDTERFSWGGIINLKIDGHLISGLSFDPMNKNGEWDEFTVDLEKRTVIGGSYSKYFFDPIKSGLSGTHEKTKTKWWKFW